MHEESPEWGTRAIHRCYIPDILRCNLFPGALGKTKINALLMFLLMQENKAQQLIFIITKQEKW